MTRSLHDRALLRPSLLAALLALCTACDKPQAGPPPIAAMAADESWTRAEVPDAGISLRIPRGFGQARTNASAPEAIFLSSKFRSRIDVTIHELDEQVRPPAIIPLYPLLLNRSQYYRWQETVDGHLLTLATYRLPRGHSDVIIGTAKFRSGKEWIHVAIAGADDRAWTLFLAVVRSIEVEGRPVPTGG